MRVTSEPQEPVQRELTALEQEIEKQTVQLREWQMHELLKLRQQLHVLEREKQQTHLIEVAMHSSRVCCHGDTLGKYAISLP